MTSVQSINKINLPMNQHHHYPPEGTPQLHHPEAPTLAQSHHLETTNRCKFKRVFSEEPTELQTTFVTDNATRTLPPESYVNEGPCYSEESHQRVDEEEEIEEKRRVGQEERFPVRFKKEEITPSALFEKKIVGKCGAEDPLISCVVICGGKAVQAGCRVAAGELQFSNGCAFRLSRITKAKIAYDQYQKCLWLTYEETLKNRPVEAKLRLHVPHDIKDDLYLVFARVVLQKLILIGHPVTSLEGDNPTEDRFKMQGALLKKSQILKKWAERKVVVTDKVESFRGGKCTFSMRSIRQVWTRFDLYETNLIIKVRHGLEKTELAVPMVNYAARFCKDNWLYRIYRLVTTMLA